MIASCSETSKAMIAGRACPRPRAAAWTSSMAWSVAVMRSVWVARRGLRGRGRAWRCTGRRRPARGTRPARPRVLALAAVGGRDRQRRDLDQGDPVGRDAVERVGVHGVAGAGAADEVGQLEQLVRVAPGEDLGQGVGAGDEVQLGVGQRGAQVAQRVDRVRRAVAVDVDPGHGEPGVRGGRDHRHQVAVLGRRDLAVGLLPRLAGRARRRPRRGRTSLHLASGDQVAVVDGVEGATHDADAARAVARSAVLAPAPNISRTTISAARMPNRSRPRGRGDAGAVARLGGHDGEGRQRHGGTLPSVSGQ